MAPWCCKCRRAVGKFCESIDRMETVLTLPVCPEVGLQLQLSMAVRWDYKHVNIILFIMQNHLFILFIEFNNPHYFLPSVVKIPSVKTSKNIIIIISSSSSSKPTTINVFLYRKSFRITSLAPL